MKLLVVPEPSARCTTTMSVSGSVDAGLSAAIAASFHFLILPAEDLGERVGVELQLVDAGQVVRHRDRRRDGREVEDVAALVVLRDVLGLDEAVGAGEVDDLGLQVALALARAAAAVVDGDVRSRSPGSRAIAGFVEGLLERRARAVQRARSSSSRCRRRRLDVRARSCVSSSSPPHAATTSATTATSTASSTRRCAMMQSRSCPFGRICRCLGVMRRA